MTSSPVPLHKMCWNAEITTILATLPRTTVVKIRRAAQRLEVSDEIAMLTVLGVTIAWLEGIPIAPVTLVAPQRDGAGEADMIGLFADVRFFHVCTAGLSHAGVALRLHHLVKQRLWREPQTLTQFNHAWINFQWTDFESRHGFTQLVEVSQNPEWSVNPLKISVDQPSRSAWRLRVAFKDALYSAERRGCFLQYLGDAISALAERPLAPVWPTGAPAAGERRALSAG